VADLDTHCAELLACKKASVYETSDSEWICSTCGKLVARTSERLPASSRRVGRPRRRSVRALAPMPRRDAAETPAPVAARLTPAVAKAAHPRAPRAPEQVMPCPSCGMGKIGIARWEAGVRVCTRCAPLEVAAVGVNKSIPVIMLASEARPEDVAQGRRRD
jgi:ribosomal protein L37AE/L43A